MTDPVVDSVSAGAQQIVDDAQRLGLTWILRPGTVITVSPLTVQFDGDTLPIGATSLRGPLYAGLRVQGLLVPPSGAFIIGSLSQTVGSMLAPPANFSAAGASGTTTSATFVNIPNLPFVTIEKRYDSTFTNISLIMTQNLFSTAVNTGAEFAINLAGGVGTDVALSTGFLNLASTHMSYAMTRLLTGLNAGTYTLSGRWRRYTGAGTLTTNGDDWSTILAEEVWAV